jgi:hypothetical protein
MNAEIVSILKNLMKAGGRIVSLELTKADGGIGDEADKK